MELLIDKSIVSNYFQVSNGRNNAEFEKYIQQAQLFDLKKLMPERFFYDLLKNKDEEKYSTLLEGGEYNFEDETYRHEGINAVLSYYTYAWYVFKSNIQDTSFGIVNKTNGQSEQVDYKERRDWFYEYKSQANQLFEDVKLYIERNVDSFPLWNEKKDNNHHYSSYKTKLIQ